MVALKLADNNYIAEVVVEIALVAVVAVVEIVEKELAIAKRNLNKLIAEKNNKHRRKWLNKILAKHIDFVLCDPGSLKPLVCIELDDISHQRPERIERDKFVNLAFKSAQLPLLRIPTQPEYRSREIRELIESVL